MIKKAQILLNSSIIYIFVLCVGLFFFSNCDLDVNRKKKDREKLIQNLVRFKTDSIRREMDTLCMEIHAQRYDGLVDSLLEVKVKKLKRNLDYYRKKENE